MKDRYAREVVNGFPYPIASNFVKLRTDECMDPGPNRLKYLLATGEAATRFLGVVNLCQARDYGEAQGKPPSKALCADFTKRFKVITWGNWLHLARESLRWLVEEQVELFVAEMGGFFFGSRFQDSAALQALGQLLTLRNGLSHEKINAMHSHEYKTLCEQAQAHLEQALESLEFLLDYELAFVSKIDVRKRRHQEPVYLHRFKLLAGDSDEFAGDRLNRAAPLDCEAVVLLHRDSGRYLNLDPLLIYEEGAGKAPDIFYYNGMDKPENAVYSACKHGGSFESQSCGRAGELAEELAQLLKLFSSTLTDAA